MSQTFLEAIHADPWGAEFLDLPSLNAKASDAIEESIRNTRQTARSQPKSLRSGSLVIVGPPGAGKTHLFARLRRKLGPRAVFVHVRPLVHGEMTPRFLLLEVVKQLGYQTQGLSQAGALVGSLLGHLDGGGAPFPTASLSDYERLSAPDREAALDRALERVLEIWPEADERYLSRLLRVPFTTGPDQRALFAWLSGRDCDAAQLDRIGAAGSLGEELLLPALRTLSAVASLGAPIVIVFDQLENLVEGQAPGARLLAYANLATELVDTMRGLVLVHMALDTEWARGVEPALNLAQRSRLLMRRETLALPSPKEREDLLRLWVERVADRPAPFPWPFEESRLEELRTMPGLTPRMLLSECRRALEGADPSAPGESAADARATDASAPDPNAPDASDTAAALRRHWEACLGNARRSIEEAAEQRVLVAAERLVDGLLLCGRFLEGVEISAKGSAPAQLCVQTAAGSAQVAVLPQANHRALGAVLGKLTALAAKHRVVLLRERAHDLPPTWKDTLAKRSALLATGRARWQLLAQDDMARLLALDELLQSARSQDVIDGRGMPISEARVSDWVASALEVSRWEVLSELVELGSGSAESDGAADDRAGPPPAVSGAERRRTAPGAPAVALSVLRQLRIASLDRVVRECVRVESSATRASVIAELEAAGQRVRWFGRTIVCVRGVP